MGWGGAGGVPRRRAHSPPLMQGDPLPCACGSKSSALQSEKSPSKATSGLLMVSPKKLPGSWLESFVTLVGNTASPRDSSPSLLPATTKENCSGRNYQSTEKTTQRVRSELQEAICSAAEPGKSQLGERGPQGPAVALCGVAPQTKWTVVVTSPASTFPREQVT